MHAFRGYSGCGMRYGGTVGLCAGADMINSFGDRRAEWDTTRTKVSLRLCGCEKQRRGFQRPSKRDTAKMHATTTHKCLSGRAVRGGLLQAYEAGHQLLTRLFTSA